MLSKRNTINQSNLRNSSINQIDLYQTYKVRINNQKEKIRSSLFQSQNPNNKRLEDELLSMKASRTLTINENINQSNIKASPKGVSFKFSRMKTMTIEELDELLSKKD